MAVCNVTPSPQKSSFSKCFFMSGMWHSWSVLRGHVLLFLKIFSFNCRLVSLWHYSETGHHAWNWDWAADSTPKEGTGIHGNVTPSVQWVLLQVCESIAAEILEFKGSVSAVEPQKLRSRSRSWSSDHTERYLNLLSLFIAHGNLVLALFPSKLVTIKCSVTVNFHVSRVINSLYCCNIIERSSFPCSCRLFCT